VEVAEYTIEHILPQNENLSKAWKEALGPEWERIRENWLHTLGNLTLTGYNSEYSDRAFVEKRDMTGGFKESPLRLNQGLGSLEQWNEKTIKTRAQRLSEVGVTVWCSPQLPADVLTAYQPSKESTTGYSIEDHPHLLSGLGQELFEAFRKEVLALDPVVSEEFLKLYVAYKAETNFVDVVPQAKRLRLSLNMPFADIADPRNMCKDVTGVGRWGNGDVEVGFSSLEELPYIMGLVRQSFERQMGNGGEQ
jgi:predicted transport protein